MHSHSEPFLLVRRAPQHERWFDAIQSVQEVPTPAQSRVPPSTARTLLAGTLIGVVGAFALFGSASLSSGALHLASPLAEGILALASVGVVLGVVLAFATRRTRRTSTLGLFGVVFAPAVWLCIDVFVLKPVGRELPVSVMTIGAIAFGACFALIAPLRGPWRSVAHDEAEGEGSLETAHVHVPSRPSRSSPRSNARVSASVRRASHVSHRAQRSTRRA